MSRSLARFKLPKCKCTLDRIAESALDTEKHFLKKETVHQRTEFENVSIGVLHSVTDRWGTIDGSEASRSQTEVPDEETHPGCQSARRKDRFTSSGHRQET